MLTKWIERDSEPNVLGGGPLSTRTSPQLEMKETEAFRVLGSADRQILLHELLRTDEGMTEERLARQLAARRHRLPPTRVSEEMIQRARIRLIHVHFPLLRELDLLEQDDGEVVLTAGKHQERLLEAATELEDWPPGDFRQLSH